MPLNVMEEDIQEISQKLTKMAKSSDSKMEGAFDLIEALEKMPVNIDVLTVCFLIYTYAIISDKKKQKMALVYFNWPGNFFGLGMFLEYEF
jgi:hypothetical protein